MDKLDKDKDKGNENISDKLNLLISQNDKLIKNQERLIKEISFNRIIMAICLIISLLYIHYQMLNFSDILGMLIQIFMP